MHSKEFWESPFEPQSVSAHFRNDELFRKRPSERRWPVLNKIANVQVCDFETYLNLLYTH